YTDKNITAEILEIIRLFSIKNKIGYFILNNIVNNKIVILEIVEELKFNPI
ncbi:hypothetical protein BGZ61DRAFT_289997, partial [Ilyonectria robusta]|uniref:uncharacterized protein n=1 Tax=Ilyonectria robusta TaxID=1079257 RepID=UPI001E8E4C0F